MNTIRRLIMILAVCFCFVQAAGAETYAGNGNTGFGGPVGDGTLTITNAGDALNFTFDRGSAAYMNDFLVLYLDTNDTSSGGYWDTYDLTDESDALRRAVSGCGTDGEANIVFDFAADYAIAFNPSMGGWLYELQEGYLFDLWQVSGSANPSDPSFTLSAYLSTMGLDIGDSFSFVGTYIASPSGFRSDEGIGDGLPYGNPGYDTVTFTGHRVFTSSAVSLERSSWGSIKAVMNSEF